MRYFAALSLSVLTTLAPLLSYGAPANDNITKATQLDANVLINRLQGDVNGVTEDNFMIQLPELQYAIPHPFPSVWFKWTAPVAGTVSIEAAGVNFTVWGITLLGPAPKDVYDVVATDYSSSSYLGTQTSFTSYQYEVEPGAVYLSGLMAYNIGSPNRYTYVHRFVQDALSDAFADRTQMAGTNFTVTGNNSTFTSEEGEPDHGSNSTLSSDHSVWTTWRSPDSRKSVTLEAKSKTFPPIIAIYTGDALTTLKLVTRSGTASSGSTGYTATASFIAEDGVDYQIAIDGDNKRAGLFTLGLKASTVRPGFITSPVGTIVEQGATATFTASAAYTGAEATYQWQRQAAGTNTWTTLSDDTSFSGTQTSVLSIVTSLDMNGDRYRVLATDEVGTSASRSATLTITEFPAVETEMLGTVSVNIAAGTIPAPTNGGGYFATGLPKGLSINPETGEITGIIDAKAGTYRVVYGSTDGKKKNAQTFILQFFVSPLSSFLSGGFEALVVTPSAPVVPYGKINFTVAQNGSFTGSYFDLADGKAYSFRSNLVLDQNLRTAGNAQTSPIEISRGASRSPLYLNVSLAEPFDVTGSTVLSATLSNNDTVLLAQATDGAPLGRFTSAQPALWAGNYNGLLIKPEKVYPDSVLPIPAGEGFTNIKITGKTGVATVRGRSAEGVAFTASLRGSSDATYRIAQRAFTGSGGMVAGGFQFIGQNGSLIGAYNVAEESDHRLYVKKPESLKDRVYPQGYPTLSYLFTVAPWVKPASGSFPLSLGLAEEGAVTVLIDAPGVSNADANERALPVNLNFSANGKVSVADTNTAKLSLTVNSATGSFSGSFLVTDPAIPPSTKATVRRVPVSGVLLQKLAPYEGLEIGGGYLLLPPLPGSSETLSGTFKILAGAASLPF